ncbi:MAG TPA: hypothetical protein VGK13_04515 [Methanocellaceae archaeon]
MKNDHIILTILIIAAIAAVVSISGCTAPAQETKNTISGKDIFDPAKFSMATYLEASNIDNNTTQFIVLAYPKEAGGNRLSSIVLSGEGSMRGDIWINKSGDHTNKIIVTDITQQAIHSQTLTLPYNLTMIDQAWNTIETEYVQVGFDNVQVPAGQFDNCTVYGTKKTIMSGGTPIDITVFYYLHPSVPVPVSYVVTYPSGSVIYGLESVYGPNDVDSTPERVIQSYLDLLNESQYTQAAQLLVKVDGDGNIHHLSRQDVLKLNDNMVQTYGEKGGKMIVQYVSVDTVQKTDDVDGHTAASAHWTSVQYLPSSGMALLIDKTSTVVDVDGHWKIVADDL